MAKGEHWAQPFLYPSPRPNGALMPHCPYARGETQDDFSGQFFRIFEIIIFCFVVTICDLVHNVTTIFHLSYVLTASGNLF